MSMTAALIVLIRLKQAKNGPIHGNIFQNPLHCALLTMMKDQKVKTADSLISKSNSHPGSLTKMPIPSLLPGLPHLVAASLGSWKKEKDNEKDGRRPFHKDLTPSSHSHSLSSSS